MNAADVMASDVICVAPDASVAEIAETLLANRISAVPVVNESGALLGIVSEGDLIRRVESDTERHRSWWLELLTGKQLLAREYVKSHALKAADVMTKPVITVKPDTPLGEIATLLEKHKIKRVPVMKGRQLVGVVSRANLIQSLVSRENKNEPDMSMEDSVLLKRVLGNLRSNPWWPGNINVIVRDGTVELWGLVDSEVEKAAVRVAVEVTPGVRAVSNKLSVKSMLTAM
jgi:CBS domain-containing protein